MAAGLIQKVQLYLIYKIKITALAYVSKKGYSVNELLYAI
jgi:hypothetical protein